MAAWTVASRQRKKNFSVEEETLLLTIIAPYLEIIESKQNRNITRKRKNEAWKNIELQFSEISAECKRSDIELRKWWDNHKTRQKSAGNVYMRSRIKIERPASVDIPCDELELGEVVEDCTLKERVDFLADVCDSNSAVDASTNEDDDAGTPNLTISDVVTIMPNEVFAPRCETSNYVMVSSADSNVNSTTTCLAESTFSTDKRTRSYRECWKRRKPLTQSLATIDKRAKTLETEKLDYLKHKRKHHDRMLKLAEEQNERAKILFDLDVKERELKIELLKVQISTAKGAAASSS